MVICGYFCIGKSSVAGLNLLDLDSGLFEGKCDDWQRLYCDVAEALSRQGITVLVGCDPKVREALKVSKERVYYIFPALELEDEWIKRLEDRYNATRSERDYKILMHVRENYVSDIEGMMADNMPSYVIRDMGFSLEDVIYFDILMATR